MLSGLEFGFGERTGREETLLHKILALLRRHTLVFLQIRPLFVFFFVLLHFDYYEALQLARCARCSLHRQSHISESLLFLARVFLKET